MRRGLADDDASCPPETAWRDVLAARRRLAAGAGPDAALALPEPWRSLYGPLVAAARPVRVIGQLGQSLDGRIATPSGCSQWINGQPALVHVHRLRALVDAVVVGIGTVLADDCALTVRHVEGEHPARVVIDPRGRIPGSARMLADDGCRRIVITGPQARPALPPGVEQLRLAPGPGGRLSPAAIAEALGLAGLRRLLVEGGAFTLSQFIAAGCLDRLHLAVAPMIIGSGPTGITLPPIDRLDAALRPAARCYPLGDDLLWDVDLAGATAA